MKAKKNSHDAKLKFRCTVTAAYLYTATPYARNNKIVDTILRIKYYIVVPPVSGPTLSGIWQHQADLRTKSAIIHLTSVPITDIIERAFATVG